MKKGKAAVSANSGFSGFTVLQTALIRFIILILTTMTVLKRFFKKKKAFTV